MMRNARLFCWTLPECPVDPKQGDWISRTRDVQSNFIVVSGLVLTSMFNAVANYDKNMCLEGDPVREFSG